MSIKNVNVLSRTLEDDYFWAPKLESKEAADVVQCPSRSNKYIPDHCSIIAEGDNGAYFMSGRMPTQRKDHVGRPITTSALFNTTDLNSALAIYLNKHVLPSWAEDYYMSNGMIGFEEISKRIEQDGRVAELDPQEFFNNLPEDLFYFLRGSLKKKEERKEPEKKRGFFRRLFR